MVDFASATAAHTEIGITLAAVAPDGWSSCGTVYWQVGPVDGITLSATLVGGQIVHLSAPDELLDYFDDLRQATAEPRKGAWWTARFNLTSDLVLTGDFDWDNEPPASFELTTSAYVEDLDLFSRDEEHRPDWLRTRLAQPGIDFQPRGGRGGSPS